MKRPILFLLLFLVHASFLGLSDDEAYYWVLAQKPALGYAYHPPAVAWMITVFQKLLGWLVGEHASGLVRLPAVLSTSLILALSLKWLEKLGLNMAERNRAFWVMLSFVGFFALSWMMVPDIPLLLSWTVLFVLTWSICFDQPSPFPKTRLMMDLGITLSAAFLVLSKYSGVLAVFSSFLCITFWAPRARKKEGYCFLFLGAILGVIPILIWNSQHDWASILYQVKGRHGGDLSWIRYLRFWALQLILAGPILVVSGWILSAKVLSGIGSPREELRVEYAGPVNRFSFVWAAPAALVFCIQPLFSDFKPHWAFVVWWPVALVLAFSASKPKVWKWARFQVGYGIMLGALVLFCCHFPVIHWVGTQLRGQSFDARLDVTNDFYGWKDLGNYIQKTSTLPVIGGRYQTASQLAFSLNEHNPVTMLPRDVKERDEWADLPVTDKSGPDWPALKSSVLFVGDQRYDSPPEFKNADCKKIHRYESYRFGLLAKWMDIWQCDPRSAN